MKSRQGSVFATLACCLLLLLSVRPAHAYIDPNAAGLVSQILTPVLVFAAAGLTFFRKRIGDMFAGISRRLGRKSDAEHAQQD